MLDWLSAPYLSAIYLAAGEQSRHVFTRGTLRALARQLVDVRQERFAHSPHSVIGPVSALLPLIP